MLKRILTALVIGSTLTFAASAPADAATKEEIKIQKKYNKTMSKEIKSYDKAVSKYFKAKSKGKSTAKAEETLVYVASRNLGWLRNRHNITKKSEENDNNRWHVAFRDVLLKVKHSKDEAERMKAMEKLSQMLKTRLERHEKKLDRMD